ncbi:hypothetical protein [Deinococcus koreensis]|uniref:Uncharacterized protein n=1 Tax=Deinococcus koreensis TaxID=2054903 RepID=A0A2K3UY40_9DEIO|nr:hypothetical protein [Deinococcus koreensis]PNY81425.1 hypothetical protein CVO96_08540 [Deinococcus koreensis]
MRTPALLFLTLLCSGPALAWVPSLEETTARNVIDGAYGRRDPLPTFQTIDLSVRGGAFVAGKDAVRAFDGGERCVADWLAAPQDFSRGSRPVAVTVSGQADQLYFQAQEARDTFRSLSVTDALGADLKGKRLADGELRVDVAVRGLPSEKARGAYLVRMKGADGKLIAPVRSSYVNDWKPVALPTAAQGGASAPASTASTAAPASPPPVTPAATGTATTTPASPPSASTASGTAAPAQGPLEGTLVYYFEPLKAGIGASDKPELLLRTEAETPCAYSVPLDLSSFQ